MTKLERFQQRLARCETKVHFRSAGDAMIFANRRGLHARHYRCDMCGEWHLTTKELNEPRNDQ